MADEFEGHGAFLIRRLDDFILWSFFATTTLLFRRVGAVGFSRRILFVLVLVILVVVIIIELGFVALCDRLFGYFGICIFAHVGSPPSYFCGLHRDLTRSSVDLVNPACSFVILIEDY